MLGRLKNKTTNVRIKVSYGRFRVTSTALET